MELIADTSFLIGLWRQQPWALEFATKEASVVLGIPWVVRGEFLHGAQRAGHDLGEVERFLELGFPLDDPVPVIPVYAQICAELQEANAAAYRLIGQNDLWIAAVAVQRGLPLVTRNQRHFQAIKELKLTALER